MRKCLSGFCRNVAAASLSRTHPPPDERIFFSAQPSRFPIPSARSVGLSDPLQRANGGNRRILVVAERPRRRFLCYAICRPSSWWIAGRGLCPGKPPESRLDGDEGNKGGQGFGKVFEVFGQTSVVSGTDNGPCW